MAGLLVRRGSILREGLLRDAGPRLSLVIAGSSPAGPPAEAWEALAPHIADGTLEVILATARPEAGGREHPFPVGVRVLRLPSGATVPRLRSLGLESATAELVALTEDFCVPVDGWVTAVLAAHRRNEAAAVGGPIDRHGGTPGQWALTLCEYGRFFGSRPEGRVRDLPGANVCYRLPRLRRALGGIPEEFEEWRAHALLRQRGEVLWWEPRMIMLDRNPTPFGAALVSLYHHGRLFGSGRVRGRGVAVRLVRAGLAPLVPVLHLTRIAGRVLPGPRRGRMILTLPLMATLLLAWSLGEGIGSLAGEGASRRHWR